MLLVAARSGVKRSGADHTSEARQNSHSFLQKLHEAERRDAEAHEAALAQALAECVLSNAAAETLTIHSVLQPQQQLTELPRLKGGEDLTIECIPAPNIPVRRVQFRSLITSPCNNTNSKRSCATDHRRRRGVSINSKSAMCHSSAKAMPHGKGLPLR